MTKFNYIPNIPSFGTMLFGNNYMLRNFETKMLPSIFMSMPFNFASSFAPIVKPQGVSSFVSSAGFFNPLQIVFNNGMNTIASFMNSLSTGFKNFSFGMFPKSALEFSQTFNSFKSGVSNFASRLISNARKYLGYNEYDGSYKKFTGGKTQSWCADFVSYIAKESGIKGFNFSSVSQILNWGKKNGKFSHTAKVGDVVIMKNGMSHTGVIESIKNGKITMIAGNSGAGNVRRWTNLSVNDPRITGFVTLA